MNEMSTEMKVMFDQVANWIDEHQRDFKDVSQGLDEIVLLYSKEDEDGNLEFIGKQGD
tara:strand:- start:555 stop:728 length:174 start_codon:yes stop_codon:yes gene_type:complete